MTLAEARIFLNLQEEGDAFDAYEEQLFHYKQFFTSRPVISATFRAKLKKLDKVQEAAHVLGIHVLERAISTEVKFSGTHILLDAFMEMQTLKSNLFQKIHQASSVRELNAEVTNLLSLFFDYSALWPESKSDPSAVILSKEPDPMDVLAELKRLKVTGIVSFEDLAKDLTSDSANVSDLIKHESMRLFLLHQKELEWTKSLKD